MPFWQGGREPDKKSRPGGQGGFHERRSGERTASVRLPLRAAAGGYFMKKTAMSLRPSKFSRTFSSGREIQCFLLEK